MPKPVKFTGGLTFLLVGLALESAPLSKNIKFSYVKDPVLAGSLIAYDIPAYGNTKISFTGSFPCMGSRS
jgi:hypothetical protein